MSLRHRLHHPLLLLALLGVVLRALVPAGFMPGDAQSLHSGQWLVLCQHDAGSGGLVHALAMQSAATHQHHAGAAPGGHAGHGGHEHQDAGSTACPFAAATVALLSSADAGVPLARWPDSAPSSALPAPAARLMARLRPPSRAPPRHA